MCVHTIQGNLLTEKYVLTHLNLSELLSKEEITTILVIVTGSLLQGRRHMLVLDVGRHNDARGSRNKRNKSQLQKQFYVLQLYQWVKNNDEIVLCFHNSSIT